MHDARLLSHSLALAGAVTDIDQIRLLHLYQKQTKTYNQLMSHLHKILTNFTFFELCIDINLWQTIFQIHTKLGPWRKYGWIETYLYRMF